MCCVCVAGVSLVFDRHVSDVASSLSENCNTYTSVVVSSSPSLPLSSLPSSSTSASINANDDAAHHGHQHLLLHNDASLKRWWWWWCCSGDDVLGILNALVEPAAPPLVLIENTTELLAPPPGLLLSNSLFWLMSPSLLSNREPRQLRRMRVLSENNAECRVLGGLLWPAPPPPTVCGWITLSRRMELHDCAL